MQVVRRARNRDSALIRCVDVLGETRMPVRDATIGVAIPTGRALVAA